MKIAHYEQIITPEVGEPVAGYGVNDVTVRIHDDLKLSVLLLDDGETKGAVLGYDLLGLDEPFIQKIRRDSAALLSCPEENVILTCTHTHTGPELSALDNPEVDEAYAALFTRKLCDAAVIAERCRQLEGSHFALLNANCQTLLESLRSGAKGYCGIMCNYHPRLYAWLGENFEKEPEKAELIQSFIGTFGFTEGGLPYPLTAKYHMSLCGIPTELTTRKPEGGEMTEYAKSCVAQMKSATNYLEQIVTK